MVVAVAVGGFALGAKVARVAVVVLISEIVASPDNDETNK